eukprot:8553509-Pyramimonas_sp.AAC.1
MRQCRKNSHRGKCAKSGAPGASTGRVPCKYTGLLDTIRTFFAPCRLSASRTPNAATAAPSPPAQGRSAMRAASAPGIMAVFAALTLSAP